MSLDRKTFLQLAVTGGLGTLFGGLGNIPQQWRDRGMKLQTIRRQSLAMGSVISFQVIAETKKDGYEAIRKATNVFRSLEHTFSMYDDQSEMAALGKAAGKQFVEVSDEAFELLRYAKKIYHQSEKHFDLTIEPAMRRWGFRRNPGEAVTPPTDRELRELERIIGTSKIEIGNNNKVLLSEPGMAIDTGGIAGGYALDKAIKEMKTTNISAAFINFSGDIHCFGEPLSGRAWPVHIWNPITQQPLTETIQLKNEALSTSGAYQNRRHNSGHHSWGHLLLPKAARPVEPLASVTAIHSSAMTADAWSTAAYVGANPPQDVRLKTLSN